MRLPLAFAVALVLCAAAFLWMLHPGRRGASPFLAAEGAGVTMLVPSTLREPSWAQARRPLPRVRAEGLRPAPLATRAPLPPLEVRVSGIVRRWGLPLEDYDCHAESQRPGLRGDWDFTDEHGRYELRLQPGTYLLAGGPASALSRSLVVPDGLEELVLDLDVP